jgi:hypothetical protein
MLKKERRGMLKKERRGMLKKEKGRPQAPL